MKHRIHAVRSDQNQAEIVQAFRSLHASVVILARLGDGVPDLLVGINNRMALVEVKRPDGKFTRPQIDWAERWRGPRPFVARDLDDVVDIVNYLRSEEFPKFAAVH